MPVSHSLLPCLFLILRLLLCISLPISRLLCIFSSMAVLSKLGRDLDQCHEMIVVHKHYYVPRTS
ncbi:hypothetical protein COCSADRAFT_39951 [Bipolaris sorokiniana ND90Pr]|uniref:Uncharacterized protein n=1 Tax=Cochliobolus sativus (strain ND90Pr / ATCC 201652) TaxID=665912 RepID=M2ST93_COCSN|nr:uncharacterized protein COCSADRAFT_39951 [Bipolaris sorokiniana ND90Pr]EMD60306.1 hypothetical protein COCSADRAFT_39951 [Bipolaris sorokiniana ND90Pr]